MRAAVPRLPPRPNCAQPVAAIRSAAAPTTAPRSSFMCGSLRRSLRRRDAQAELFDRHLAHPELLDFARDGRRKLVNELPIGRDFESRDAPAAECDEVVAAHLTAGPPLHPGHYLLAGLLAGHADDLHVEHGRVAVEIF